MIDPGTDWGPDAILIEVKDMKIVAQMAAILRFSPWTHNAATEAVRLYCETMVAIVEHNKGRLSDDDDE